MDLKVDIFEKTLWFLVHSVKISIISVKIKSFALKIMTFPMKIKTFHMKISSVLENENFSQKCELLGFLVTAIGQLFKNKNIKMFSNGELSWWLKWDNLAAFGNQSRDYNVNETN